QRDVDAGGDGGMNRIAVLIRQPSLAVEQRAVYVDADQSNHAQFCGPSGRAGYDRKVMTLGRFGGVNAGYVLELYERFRQNPESVDPATRAQFETWTPPELEAGTGAPVGTAAFADVHAVVAATILADSIRRYGHLAAQLDPLGSTPIGDPSLSPASYGITDEDLKRLPGSLVGGPVGETSSTAYDAIEKLRRVYCSSTGFDYSHIFVPEERDWLRH